MSAEQTSEQQELQRLYWFLDDYRTVAYLLQEMAYRLAEIRERTRLYFLTVVPS